MTTWPRASRRWRGSTGVFRALSNWLDRCRCGGGHPDTRGLPRSSSPRWCPRPQPRPYGSGLPRKRPFAHRKSGGGWRRPMPPHRLSRSKEATLKGRCRGDPQRRPRCARPLRHAAEQSIVAMTALKGVGVWTAEVYLLFCAGHADIFPAVTSRCRARRGNAFGLDRRPDQKTLRQMAAAWQPWRGVAARLSGRIIQPRCDAGTSFRRGRVRSAEIQPIGLLRLCNSAGDVCLK